jgi:hypothetical protein
MANDVFANNREISCKKADGKSICAFPDVCFTPPTTPATPPGVPVPYPNTGLARDTTDGSRSVKISGKEVMLKNTSYFKKSTGDEAGSAPKKGLINSTHRGKIYFISWSMNVKIESKNVVRHLDKATHNHASPLANDAVPWLYADAVASGKTDDCAGVRKDVEDNCSDREFNQASPPGGSCGPACCEAKKCVLSPKGTNPKCCGGQTKHHVIPDHCFKERGEGGYYAGITDMSYGKGLCVCVDGTDKSDRDPGTGELQTHGKIHADFDEIEDWYRDNRDSKWSFEDANEVAADVCAFHTGCDKDCLKQQTEQFYKNKDVGPGTTLRADSGGRLEDPTGEMGVPYAGWRQRFG